MGLNWIWFALVLFVLLVDFLTSNFTYSWLALGFIPAFFLGFFVGFEIQVVVALVIGVLALIYGLKVSKKYIKTNISQEKLLMGKYEGKEFVAQEQIEKETRIKINEVFWAVKNIGEKINKGDTFKVLEVKDNKLIVRKGDE
ncbi:NfeD family protein [Clostridium tunisiense]|uniref:NfeD family protein n=1 Tax=Clostridium tunisiense TaxID=219748 RepID=UPI0002EA6699|nr:NfeD family protein [Clostridium tunisiense]